MVGAMLPAAFYVPDGELFIPTAATSGPWSPDAQHAGPPSALLTRAIERVSAIEGGQTVRIAFEILRPVPLAPLAVSAEVLRGGRRVELCGAELSADGTPVMQARAWRMRREALAIDLPDPEPPPPDPETLRLGGRPRLWKGEDVFWDALEWRWAAGDFDEPGPSCVWSRMRVALVEGEPISPLEHLVAMTDAASGTSSVLDWSQFSFANVDLTLALERQPEGEWVAMDTVTHLGPQGAGVAQATLFDARGRIGSSSAALLVAKS
jgi:hypothetical protein